MTQAWDFVNANLLWQRAGAEPPQPIDTEFLAKRVDEIDWGLRVGARIRFLSANYHELEQVNGDWDYVSRPIITVAHLVQKTEAQLLRQANFSRISLAGIKQILSEHGLRLEEGP